MANPSWSSPLRNFPDHVNAIGMITIEMGILEASFVQLFGAILRVHESVAASIMMSPRSTRARLDILENVSKYVLFPDEQRSVENLIKRGNKLLGKRNDIMHEIWGISRDGKQVVRIPPPYGTPYLVELQELNTEIENLRYLQDEIGSLRQILAERPHYRINITND